MFPNRCHLIYCYAYAPKKISVFEFFCVQKFISCCWKYAKKLKKSQKWLDLKKSYCRIQTFEGFKFGCCKLDSNTQRVHFRGSALVFELKPFSVSIFGMFFEMKQSSVSFINCHRNKNKHVQVQKQGGGGE